MNYLFNLASLFGLTFRVLTIALVNVFGAANVAAPKCFHLTTYFSKSKDTKCADCISFESFTF